MWDNGICLNFYILHMQQSAVFSAAAQQSNICSRKTEGIYMLVNQSNDDILINRTPNNKLIRLETNGQTLN